MLKTGDRVGHFIIDSVLGEGGMGIVYKAHDERLSRDIAIKVLATQGDEEGAARVLREARVAAALDHPNAVTVFEGGVINGEPYIAMELVQGETLRSFVGNTEIPVARKIRWLVEIGQALGAAHQRGIVHRDVKPENVMVRPDGRIKVLDFGIARRAEAPVDAAAPTARIAPPTLTTKGAMMGTPMYMSPEQVRGKTADGRSDQFAWAVVAYELLEGERPWHAHDTLGVVAAMMSEPPRPMQAKGVPDAVKNVIMRALSLAPAERFGALSDVVSLLAPFAEGAEAKGPRSGAAARENGKNPITGSRYTTQELGQAIALALDRKAKIDAEGGKYSFDDLRAAAQEVGIEESELREAIVSLRNAVAPAPAAGPANMERANRKEDDADRAMTYGEKRLRSKQKLQRHAAIWGVVGLFFALLAIVTGAGLPMMIPFLCWGVGVGIHAATFFFPVMPTPEEEELERLILAKRREKINRKLAQQSEKPREKLRIAEQSKQPEARADSERGLEELMLAEEEAQRNERKKKARR